MATFSNANYSGPFSSKYEEAEALSGERGPRAAYVAGQAQHSRGLRSNPNTRDTSIFGTNRTIGGKYNPALGGIIGDQYENPKANPMYSNYRSPPRQTTGLDYIGPPSQRGQAASGGFFPSLAGPGPNQVPDPNDPSGFKMIPEGGIMNARKGMQQDAAMGVANIIGNPNDPRSLVNMGFSPTQAQEYQRRTGQNLADQRHQQFLYGDRRNERGTQGTQATAPTGEVVDPNYIPPHLRYLMAQQDQGMNMGGIVSLSPMMQMQDYNMGRQMAQRDMGRSV